MPVSSSQALAVDISLAALLGKGVYNFGELLLHPIVSPLPRALHPTLLRTAGLHGVLFVLDAAACAPAGSSCAAARSWVAFSIPLNIQSNLHAG